MKNLLLIALVVSQAHVFDLAKFNTWVIKTVPDFYSGQTQTMYVQPTCSKVLDHLYHCK